MNTLLNITFYAALIELIDTSVPFSTIFIIVIIVLLIAILEDVYECLPVSEFTKYFDFLSHIFLPQYYTLVPIIFDSIIYFDFK